MESNQGIPTENIGVENHQGIPEQTMVVILAAGKGTRMGRADLVKVCFEIDGVPAINRLIDAFKRARFRRFLLVVGAHAEQVMEAVGKEHPEVLYVHQTPQLGTGHAAKAAASALQAIGYDGYVLVSMGDKLLEEVALETLVSGYVRQRADLALATVPKSKATESSAGRVLVDEDGNALDIIERVDLARQMIADEIREMLARGDAVTGLDVRRIVDAHVAQGEKQEKAVGDLLSLAESHPAVDRAKLEKVLQSEKYQLHIDGKQYTGKQLDRLCSGVNPSLYLMRAAVFYQGVSMIRNDNAQGEYYITDMVRLLAGVKEPDGHPRFRVRAVALDQAEWVQGFNSPDELLAIQDYLRRQKLTQRQTSQVATRPRLKAKQYATVRQWLAKLEAAGPPLKRWLRKVYGPHEDLHRQKCRDLTAVLECYGKRFGMDEKVCLLRAPGRVNLMGRHVDHRGGMTNFLAIDRETLAVAGTARRRPGGGRQHATRQIQARPVQHSGTHRPICVERLAGLRQQRLGSRHGLRQCRRLGQLHQGRHAPAPAPLPGRARPRDQHGLVGQRPDRGGAEQQFHARRRDPAGRHRLEQFRSDQPAIHRLVRRRRVVCRVARRRRRSCRDLSRPAWQDRSGRLLAVPRRADHRCAPGLSPDPGQQPHQGGQERSARDQFNSRIASYNLGLALLKQRCPEIAGDGHVPSRLGSRPGWAARPATSTAAWRRSPRR